MIHFDFIVSDVDAENIMECISAEITNCHVRGQKALVARNKAECDEHNARANYLKNLKTKMKNTRVEKELLFRFEFDCGRQGDLEGLFVATQEEVDALIGKSLYFCEPFGKHSEVKGVVEKGEITLVSDDRDFIEKSLEIGTIPSGYNPLYHIYCDKCNCCEDCSCNKG